MSSDVPRPTDHTCPRSAPHSTTPASAPFYPPSPSTSRDPALNWITAEPAPSFSRAGLSAGDIVLPQRKNSHAPDGDDSDGASSTVSERRASFTSDDSDGWGNNHTGNLADVHTRDRWEDTAPPARDVDVDDEDGTSAESALLSKESDVVRARIGRDGLWAAIVRTLVG